MMSGYVSTADRSEPCEADVSAALERLSQFAASHESQRLVQYFEALQGQLESRSVNLVVFGEFKRGKSTLINALVGRPLLPSSVIPLTAVVTVVRYSTHPFCRISYDDGRSEEVPLENLAAYVTEKENPNNEKGVSVAEVGIPADLLATGLRLVDTPGVGSVYLHNTEATKCYLDQVDGALLVLAADPPISQSELQFVQEIMACSSRVFVVLNKVDQLSGEDLDVALEFTRKVLTQMMPTESMEILPVSARQGLQASDDSDPAWADSGMQSLTQRLREFAAEELGKTLCGSAARRGAAAAGELLLTTELQLRGLELTQAELAERTERFRSRRDELVAKLSDSRDLVRATTARVVHQHLRRDYDRGRREGLRQVLATYDEWAAQQEPKPFAELLEALNSHLAHTLREAITAWRAREEQQLNELLQSSLDRFGSEAEATLADIYEAAREIYNLPSRSIKAAPALPAQSRFRWQDWHWKIDAGLAGEWHWRLLPGSGARNALLRAGRKRLAEEFEKACGRLRHDFEGRLRAAAEEYMDALTTALKRAMGDVDEVLERLSAQQQDLSSDGKAIGVSLAEEARFLHAQIAVLERFSGTLAQTRAAGGH